MDKHRTEMQTSISILEKIQRKEFKHYNELGLGKLTYGSFVDSNFEWACDNCLNTKKVILASPGLQQTPSNRHLAYCDKKLHCFSCGVDFIFKKEEKKAWYESYKLPINAIPNNCLDCRRKVQKHNSENKNVSEILRKPENDISVDELNELVAIYVSWEKVAKAKYYQSILNKRLKRQKN